MVQCLLGLGPGAAGTPEEGREPGVDSAKPLAEVAGRRRGRRRPGGAGRWKSFPQVTADECRHGSLGGGAISYLDVCPEAELWSQVSGVPFTVASVRAAYPAQLPLKKKDALLWFAFIIRPPIHSYSKPAVGAEYGGGFCREASLL